MTRVVFFGQSLAIFDWLILQSEIDLVMVYTPRLQDAHRGHWMTRALLAHTQLIEIGKIQELAETLPANVDLGICAHFEIIPERVVSRFRLGIINVHPAPLPDHPGRYPLVEICLRGERSAGVSLHWMSAEVDRGDLIAVERFPRHPLEGPIVLEQRAERTACQLLGKHWAGIIAGYAPRVPQQSLSLEVLSSVKHSRELPSLTLFESLEELITALIAYAPYGGLALERREHQGDLIRIDTAQLIELSPILGNLDASSHDLEKRGDRYFEVLEAERGSDKNHEEQISLEVLSGWGLVTSSLPSTSLMATLSSSPELMIVRLSLSARWVNRMSEIPLKEDLTQLVGQRLYSTNQRLYLP